MYRWNSALDGLAAFVEGLNASRPRALCLDRVIVNYGMCLTLFGNDRRTDSWAIGYPFYDGRLLYRNMSVLGGIAFLHHPGVPHDGAYALSSAQGPVFAHGPSRIDCTDGEIAVSRHCGIVDPPRGLPECPWGVRFGTRKDRDAGNEWPEDSEWGQAGRPTVSINAKKREGGEEPSPFRSLRAALPCSLRTRHGRRCSGSSGLNGRRWEYGP